MSSIEKMIFQIPLYNVVGIKGNYALRAQLTGNASVNIDGHCPGCKDRSTFLGADTGPLSHTNPTHKHALNSLKGYKSLTLFCARNGGHSITIWFDLRAEEVVKVGQFPSLADIANDEAKSYRSTLEEEDAAELHKAIGLAAHGVGVGSFVYLRRVFERVVARRFEKAKSAEGWTDKDFYPLHMDQKIKFLKDHVPPFLYENRAMYSILSKGVHSLTEKECLDAFDPLKFSLKIVLEEDKKKEEEDRLKAVAAQAIKDFASKHSEAE